MPFPLRYLRLQLWLHLMFLHPPVGSWPKQQGILVVDEELPLSVSGRLHGKPRIPSFCVPCARWGPRGGTTVAAPVWRSIGGVKHRSCVNPLHTCTVTSRPVPSWLASDKSRGKESGKERKRPVTIASPAGSFISRFSTIERSLPCDSVPTPNYFLLLFLCCLSCCCAVAHSPFDHLPFLSPPDSPPTSAPCSTAPTSCNLSLPASDVKMVLSHARTAAGSASRTSRVACARLFSTQSALRQQIQDAYILSGVRTPTAKVKRSVKTAISTTQRLC